MGAHRGLGRPSLSNLISTRSNSIHLKNRRQIGVRVGYKWGAQQGNAGVDRSCTIAVNFRDLGSKGKRYQQIRNKTLLKPKMGHGLAPIIRSLSASKNRMVTRSRFVLRGRRQRGPLEGAPLPIKLILFSIDRQRLLYLIRPHRTVSDLTMSNALRLFHLPETCGKFFRDWENDTRG
jgi:hypothetical protein